MTEVVTVEEFRRRLSPLLKAEPDGAVVFDADGTLWSHDVGCFVFDAACEQGVFKEEAFLPLRAEVEKRGLDLRAATTANDAARALQKAWYSGKYNERAAAEMQVWAYVGFSEQEFRSFVLSALDMKGHERTLHQEILDLAAWVREQGVRALIVSASPLWVVQEATKAFGFKADEIAAGIPKLSSEGHIMAHLKSPLPYGPDKVNAGRALLGRSTWLAALGDSHFDLAMMQEARLAGGIGKKPGLLEGLKEIPHALRVALHSDRS